MDDETLRELYQTPIDFVDVVSRGSDEEFAALAARLDEIGRDTIPGDVLINCSTYARCAYFLKRFNISVDAIICTGMFDVFVRDNPFATTLLNFHCRQFWFYAQAAEDIRGLLSAGARVDTVSDLGDTPLETFHRSVRSRADPDCVTDDVENIVHAMLHAEGHSADVFHDGVKRILASGIHPGFETLRNYEVVEAFAKASLKLPMELCRMVACAMGVPP